jgi:putative flippase GtrA
MTSIPPARAQTPADRSPAAAEAPEAPEVSVVVPTRNESDNIGPLVARLAEALDGTPFEIVFVDDSDDETPDQIATVAAVSATVVRLVHRPRGERPGGLGGAVATGLAGAAAPWVVVMDGDLQHPPAAVPRLLAAATGAPVDAVVASRYRDQGSAGGLGGWLRRLVSRASGSLARFAFPRRLGGVTDPMSGFFAVRRDAVDPAALRPDGYKILLDVLLRNRIERLTEVAYEFQPRSAGQSKASVRQGLRYLRHLARLRLATTGSRSAPARFVGFAVAGASGVAMNSALLAILAGPVRLPYLFASFLATQVTIVWNFLVVDLLVMAPDRGSQRHRFGRFWLINSSAVPLHLALLGGLVQVLGVPLLPANVAAVSVVFLLRYAATSRWVYGPQERDGVPPVRRLLGRLRRAALSRVGLAVTLTALAFPTVTAATWSSLWRPSPQAALLVPLLAAAAMLVAQIRPATAEPDVHDRQLDLLIAGFLLAATVGLVAVAPRGTVSGSLLLASVCFLGAGVVLLLGTRTAGRLRWAMVLPVVAIDAATPAPLEHAATWVLRQGVAAVSLPFSDELDGSRLAVRYDGRSLAVPDAAMSPVPLMVAALCLILAGLSFLPLRRLVVILRVTAAAVGALVLAMAAGRLFGPQAMRVALTPLVMQAAVAVTVVAIVWRWSSVRVLPRVNGRYYMPRGRIAAVVLLVAAILLGLASPAALTGSYPAPRVEIGAGDRAGDGR